MKPVHVVLISIAASFAGIIALVGALFVGFVGVVSRAERAAAYW